MHVYQLGLYRLLIFASWYIELLTSMQMSWVWSLIQPFYISIFLLIQPFLHFICHFYFKKIIVTYTFVYVLVFNFFLMSSEMLLTIFFSCLTNCIIFSCHIKNTYGSTVLLLNAKESWYLFSKDAKLVCH